MSGGNNNPPGRPVVIKLTVSASNLAAISNPNSLQISANCWLFDDKPGRPPYVGTNEDFTSDVYLGKEVTWRGVTSDPNGADRGYSIAIYSIVYEPNSSDPNDVSFFPSPLMGKPGRTGDASTTIPNDSNIVSKHDIYRINFYIYKPGDNNPLGPYPIDPKLQGNR